MENNNGRGIFYGVIGVATLVVAIIGATFAYFSASAANNNAIKVGTTSINLSLVSEQTNYYTDMIPVASTNANFKLYPGLTKKNLEAEPDPILGKGTCTDDRGNAICGIYEFGIKNPSDTVTQTVYGSLEVKATDFPVIEGTGKTNVHYAVFKGTAAQVAAATDKFTVTGTAKDVDEAALGGLVVAKAALGAKDDLHGQTTDWKNTEQILAPGATQMYTIVVWLEENGDKNSGDQGKMFTAAIKFDTSAGGSGVTGTLSAAA